MINRNVLLISGVKGDTRRYRTLHAYEQLSLAGLPADVAHITDPGIKQKTSNADIVVFHRVSNNPLIEQLVQVVRKQNGLLVLDADDFLYNLDVIRWINSPDFSDPVRLNLYKKEISRHRETLRHCRAIITSTDYLSTLLSPFGKPVYVHRNGFSREMLLLSERAIQKRAKTDGKVVIGYASGTPTHNRDFEIIAPALQSILSRFEQVELLLVGPLDMGAGWEAVNHRIRRIPLVPWRQLPDVLAKFDINLAPLVLDNPFSQSKSEIKFMEAALVQVPTVASPTDAFCYAIQPNIDGFLAESSAEWESTLAQLVEDDELRASVGLAAQRNVLKEYHPVTRSEELVRILGEIDKQHDRKTCFVLDEDTKSLIERNAKMLPILPALDHRFPEPTLIQMGVYSLRYRGFATLMGEVWVFLRRKLSFIFPFQPYIADDEQVVE